MTPTPTAPRGLRPHTLYLRDATGEPIGTCAIRLVLPLRRVDAPNEAVDANAWAITHTLGAVAGGTHTEVAFVDDTASALEERHRDDLVRVVANLLYERSWAFHYRPEQYAGSVLAHGSILRERVEVSEVELWVEQ